MEPQSRRPDRVSVHVDGAFALGLAAEVAAELGLTRGRSVDAALLAAAAAQDEARRARRLALRLLAVRAHTRHEIATRLRRRGFSAAAGADTLAYLEGQGWVDDAQFARDYVRTRLQAPDPPGERRLSHELARRGVPPALAAAALAECVAADPAAADPVAAATAIARRRLARISGLDRRTAWRRLAGYLGRRGYDAEIVIAALRVVLDAWEPDAEA